MVVQKFNSNDNYYPIVKVPSNILKILESGISNDEILIYLGENVPNSDFRIKKIVSREFYDDNDSLKDYNSKEIEKFKQQFPNFTFKESFSKITYTAEYYVNEEVFFSKKSSRGNYYINNILLPNKPTEFKEFKIKKFEWGCFGSIFSVLIILFLIIFFNSLAVFTVFFFTLVLFIVFFYNSIIERFSVIEKIEIKKDEADYNWDLIDFRKEIKKIKEKIIEEYKVERRKSDIIVNKNRNEVEIKILNEALKSSVGFIKKNHNQSRGKCEIFFLNKLYEKFKSQICVDIIPNVGKNPFQPDFLFVCSETGFHINIEIDEPYSVEKGQPIHHDRSNDDERNDFFNEINWGVIRFSEKQIIENIDECIDLIQNVLFSIRNKENSFKHLVPLHEKWTYEEALIMSNNEYRNTYLPNNMKIKINYKSDSYPFGIDDLPF